jgi:hypothetical protein
MPFSTRPQEYIRKNLAYLKISLVLTRIIYNYKIRPDITSNISSSSLNTVKGHHTSNQYQLHNIFVGIRDRPIVQLAKQTYSA